VTWHEDRDAVMISAPVIDLLHSASTGKHRACRIDFIHEVCPPGCPLRVGGLGFEPIPLVQSQEAIAARIARFIVRTRDVPVE
jgi:hypothetical protein